MLESLTSKLKAALQRIASIGVVDKEAVASLLNEVKRALLSGDVDVALTNQLCATIERRAFEPLQPGITRREHVIKVVYEELTKILGGEKPEVTLRPKKILLVGLFGSGKTSTAAKLARWYQTRGLRPALVCCDTARPAAYEQLQQLATQIGVPFYGEKMERNSATILRNALKNIKADVLIVDSSGRNALDPELIAEIKELDKILNPDERILVLPADIGQAAKTQAAAFQSALGITNIILTKLDATAKGGGALAACHATGAKIQFVTTGEKPDAIELYDPPRFVGRLIGMSDLETLLERAAAVAKPAVAEKIVSAKFDLNDFVEQMEATQQIGPFGQIAEMLGIGKKIPKELLEQQQAKIKKWKHILNSMTPTERSNPDIIDSARISRIARGSGVQEAEVRDLLAQYNKTKKMIKKLGITRTRGRDLAKLLKGFGM